MADLILWRGTIYQWIDGRNKNRDEFSLYMPKESNGSWILNLVHDLCPSSYSIESTLLIQQPRFGSYMSCWKCDPSFEVL